MRKNIKPINILFRNDDPCALSDAAHERRYLEIFAKYGIPQVVSVIPFMSEDIHNYRQTRFHALSENPGIVELLREYMTKGLIEVAQHGTTHQTNSLHPGREPVNADEFYQGLGFKWLPYAPIYPGKGYSEFNGLGRNFVRAELKRGRDHLEEALRAKIETFVFPWGTLDLNVSEALKEEGYQTALCGGRSYYFVKDLMDLHNAREDVFEFAKEFNNGNLGGPALYHVVFHSWMFKEPDFEKLDDLLSGLAKDDRVRFVTAKELRQWPASFHAIRLLDHKARMWAQMANRHLGHPIEITRRYGLDIKSYGKELLKAVLFITIFEKIGFNRFWILSAILSFVFFWLGRMRQEAFVGIFMALALCFGALFIVTTLLQLKIFFGRLSHGWSKRPISENYKTIASEAFQDPYDRKKALKYFQVYSTVKEHSEDDAMKYLQLQYIYSKKPAWLALNQLIEIYIDRNQTFLALCCCLESLRLNCKQEKIYDRAELLSKEFKYKFPESLLDNEITVSVIMPANRKSEEIKEAIQSVLNQTFQDFELIVINDGGPQEIQNIVESFRSNKIRYFRLDQCSGPGAARNMGVLKARGKYLAYLDDDDVYYPHHLETLVGLLKESRSKFGYTNMVIVSGSLDQGRFKPDRTAAVWDVPFDRGAMVSKTYMGTNTILHEKVILKGIGLFNEKLRPGQDEDLWIRCAARYDFKHISVCTSEYRRKDDNAVKQQILDCFFNNSLYRKYYAFSHGKIAFIKYFLSQKNIKQACALYEDIKRQYPDSFKTIFVLSEVMQIARRFNDKDFIKQIAHDYCHLSTRHSNESPGIS
ncbi:MAG: glycosyltransferase [Candidatus Omnitrophica bacterium]|nr:glycosyltransferase [Candidatus Omnitrophota bacterium]